MAKLKIGFNIFHCFWKQVVHVFLILLGYKEVIVDLWNRSIPHWSHESYGKVLNSIKTIRVRSMCVVCPLNTWPGNLTKLDYDDYMCLLMRYSPNWQCLKHHWAANRARLTNRLRMDFQALEISMHESKTSTYVMF